MLKTLAMIQYIKKHIQHYGRKTAGSIIYFLTNPIRILRYYNKIQNLDKSQKPIRLNVGSGNHKGENGWTNIDYEYGADVAWDFNWGLPFSSNRIEEMHSTHIFEHFSYKELIPILNECYRCLKEGAQFSICVPNARLYIEGYQNPESFDSDKFLTHIPASHVNSPIDYINYVAYMDGHHKIMYDENNLIQILKNIGFSDVNLREFDPSVDLERRRYESLYVLAVK